MAYTVVRGDSLGAIARANNMTLADLLALNPQIKNPDLIHPGDKIILSETEKDQTEATGTTEDGQPDYTDDEDTRFKGLPGQPELWKNGDKWYAVYYIPGTDPPVPLLYEVASQEDLQSFFGEGITPVADRDVTDQIIKESGGTVFGSTDQIPATEGDPWAGFLARMDRAAETQPWLNDPDVFAVHANAWMEGREVEKWELEGTDWWQTQNEAQRDWAWTIMRDPTEAATRLADRELDISERFKALGMTVSDDVVKYMAEQQETGNWTQGYTDTQINALAGGENSSYDLDEGLSEVVNASGEVAASGYKTQDVIDQFKRWLGPMFGQIDETEAAKWATRLREEGDVAQEELTRHLQQMRMAVLPEYTDPTMAYAEIAQPWLNYGTQIWGQQMDETSDIFIEMLRANDATEAKKLLRREGLNQGIGKVEQSFAAESLGQEGALRRAAR